MNTAPQGLPFRRWQSAYISKLETENKDLRAKVDKLVKDELALRLKLLDYERQFEIDDEESVCSNTDESCDSEDEVSSADQSEIDECYNFELVQALSALAYHEKNEHKADAYAKAADAIYDLKFKVDNGHELAIGDKKVPGIGKSIARLIDEFLETGKIKKLDQLAAVDETRDDYLAGGHNDKLVCHIDKLAREEEDHFKSVAYKKAARAIEALNFKVTNGEELAKGPKKVPGIGKSIARKIDDFFASQKKVSFELESNPVSTNEEIAWHLDVLASLEAEEHGSQDPHKIRAYRKAAEAIRDLDFEVTNGTEISQGPKKVPGIGKSIARKIDELIVNGYIQRIRDLSE